MARKLWTRFHRCRRLILLCCPTWPALVFGRLTGLNSIATKVARTRYGEANERVRAQLFFFVFGQVFAFR